jgi:hypothetical protein
MDQLPVGGGAGGRVPGSLPIMPRNKKKPAPKTGASRVMTSRTSRAKLLGEQSYGEANTEARQRDPTDCPHDDTDDAFHRLVLTSSGRGGGGGRRVPGRRPSTPSIIVANPAM